LEDFWLIRTDANGDVVWNKTYGGASNDVAWSLVQTNDEGYVLAGYTESFGAGSRDAWLVETDSAGNEVWNRTYGGAGDDRAISLLVTLDGGYAFAGYGSPYVVGGTDFWLVKTDSSGNMQWNKTCGGENEDYVQSLVQTNDEGYAMAGGTYSYGAGSCDFWLVKIARAFALSGKVTEIDGVTPVVGASVEALQEGDSVISSTTTDSQGSYTLTVSHGDYKLLIRADDHLVAIRPVVSIVAESMANVNFNLTRGQMLVFDDFVGTSLNTSKWEGTLGGWGSIHNVTSEPTKFSVVEVSSMDGGGAISSKVNASLDSTIIFEGRISAYTQVYGDQQPRGLRVGTDGNNAIEFTSSSSSSVRARTVASGVATETSYALPYPKTVGDWNLTYKIIANSTLARFYVNDVLIATHTTNIPTGPLNIYMGTHGGGNLPVAADYLFMATKSISASISPTSVIMDISQSCLFTSTISGEASPYSYQWYLNDAPVSGATGETWTFTPPSVGSYTVYVNVTDNVGGRAVSNTATVTVLTHDVALTDVAPFRITVTQGYGLNVSVTVKNFGNYTETFNVTLYANGLPVHTFTNVDLTPGSTVTLTIEVGFTKGFYTISAYAWPVEYEINTSDNTYIGPTILVAPRPFVGHSLYQRPIPL
jgi:hypothetical protein